MKTSREAFEFLEANCTHTDRDIFEKKGVGIYCRQFHWVSQKEVRPLAKLAEVNTVVGSDSMHMFYDTGHVMHILVREVACFSCANCKQMKWRQCLKTEMCGHAVTREVTLKSQNRVCAPLTASRIITEAKETAAAVQPGMVLGVECASEQEPYIILEATSALYEYTGEDMYTWMGWVRAGDMIIDTIKFERYGGTDLFWTLTDKKFPIFEEDLRSIITEYEAIEVRKSKRQTAQQTKRIEVEPKEIQNLEVRVMADLNSESKRSERPRRQASS
jgi:hypothetical protein